VLTVGYETMLYVKRCVYLEQKLLNVDRVQNTEKFVVYKSLCNDRILH